jgi:hypothetical protein
MMFNPGGLGSMLTQQSGMPDDEFARSAEQSMLRTGKTPITMLADLARRVTARKSAMMQQGLQAGAQMRSQPPTLKDQLQQEALALGIGSQPYGYAGGGLVAFEDGGMAEEEPLTAADIEGADLEDAMAEAASEVPNFKQLDRLQAQYNMLQQQLAAANRSGDPNAVRHYVAQLKNAKDALDAAIASSRSPQRIESFVRTPAPAVDPSAGTAAMPRANAPGQGNATPAAANRSFSTSGANPGAGARSGTGTGAEAGTSPVMPSPAATAAAIAKYLKEGEEAIGRMEGRGKVTAGELALREALLKAQDAEREQRVEYKEPEGLTTREKLQLASFDSTKGKWMSSLAEKAAGVMTARETKAEEFRKLNREIDVANRRLNTALAQQRLAYARGDRQDQEAADTAVANAKLALREKTIEFGLKAEDTESKRITAEAARTAAGQRGAGTDTNRQRLALQALKADPSYKAVQEALVNAQTAANAAPNNVALKTKLQKAQDDAIALMRKHGVESEEEGAGPSAAPTAGAAVLKFDAQGNRIP